MSLITIERKILEKNDVIAAENRRNFKSKNIFAINLVSSPGSGKTSLVERTLHHLNSKITIAVIVGDVQTDLDAQRVEALNTPVIQIITNGACHLEANLVRDAFNQFQNLEASLLFIENVGNLVCPAGYDLGEDMKVIITSTTEGDDKPLKYPAMFRNSSALIINKIDLLPYVNCSVDTIKQNALLINRSLIIFEVSCKTDDGIPEWCEWLQNQVK
jgi:hydrogenase nickel incorporation protein HypB